MENNMNLNNANQKDEIDIKKILLIIWQGKLLIATLTILFSFTALFYSLSLKNIYQSNAVLSSTELTNSNNQSSSLGGLASIAGINIQSGSQGKTALAIEKIKTLSFFEDNILPNIYLPDLMALKSWDVKSNTHLYNEDIYDSEKNLWISMPSPQKSYRSFRSILTVKENRDGSLITISIKHNSPYIAQAWTELIVDQINRHSNRRQQNTLAFKITHLKQISIKITEPGTENGPKWAWQVLRLVIRTTNFIAQ